MKHVALVAALLALSLTACGEKPKAPEVEAPVAVEVPAPVVEAPAPVVEAATAAADAAGGGVPLRPAVGALPATGRRGGAGDRLKTSGSSGGSGSSGSST